jgi:hypothetical protein
MLWRFVLAIHLVINDLYNSTISGVRKPGTTGALDLCVDDIDKRVREAHAAASL